MAATAGLLLVTLTEARAATLAPNERARLESGEVVVHEDNVQSGDHRYVGGMCSVVVHAPVERVVAALDDVGAYGSFLPRTRSVRWIGLSRSGDAVVQIEQGTAVAHGRYTVRIRKEQFGRTESGTVRFWLDPAFAHDIEDARGYFRVEPFGEGRSLLTYMVLVDLGPGIFRRLFEEKVRAAALSTPALVRGYVESLPRRATGPARR